VYSDERSGAFAFALWQGRHNSVSRISSGNKRAYSLSLPYSLATDYELSYAQQRELLGIIEEQQNKNWQKLKPFWC
jgi:hypothetical protein